ncbi:hypothetical protein [Streptomyces sp. TP-A0356]|uniref:hypothetical protein n=1 Tax=Streptomyces sp. TP-A0356 TaxID=1359208 RepID=UPI0006E37BFA|nr:hypothetical protein [Streptomyces sp. TP-A0356]
MSGSDAVTQHQRRRLLMLIREHPGRTAEELSARLSAADRSMLGLVLRSARECCLLRADDEGRYWAT